MLCASPLFIWPHLFRVVGHEKRGEKQLKWSLQRHSISLLPRSLPTRPTCPASRVTQSCLHTSLVDGFTREEDSAGRSGLVVACLTAVREVLGSKRDMGSCVYRTTTAIYSLGHELCAPFLLCQLSLLPSMGR